MTMPQWIAKAKAPKLRESLMEVCQERDTLLQDCNRLAGELRKEQLESQHKIRSLEKELLDSYRAALVLARTNGR